MNKIFSLVIALLMLSTVIVLNINNASAYENIPILSISEDSRTVFWGFDGNINISVKNNDSSLTNLTNVTVTIFNDDDINVTGFFNSSINIAEFGYILINDSTWGIDDSTTFGGNGTWSAYLSNYSDNASLMWNLSINFYVEKAPNIQWKWVDDDGVLSTNDVDRVIPEVPNFSVQPIVLQFKIVGKDHNYFGDGSIDPVSDYGKNITVSGNALLLPKTLNDIPGVSYSGHTWNVPLTPIMTLEGREITFSLNWKEYGKFTETLNIGGLKHNGSIVSISPSEFTIDEDIQLTVTVTDAEGTPSKTASIWLYWLDDNGELQGLIASRNGGGDNQGQYIFTFNRSQQTQGQLSAFSEIKAPRHIVAYVKLYQGIPEFVYGYALAKILPKNDLQVAVSEPVIKAGEMKKFTINTTLLGGTYPQDIKVDIFDSNNKKISSDITLTSITDSDLQGNNISLNDYIILPGFYTIYAYNGTHGSSGYNATLEIKSVDVTFDTTELIWKYDTNKNFIVFVNYTDVPVDGKLYVYNMTKQGTGYKTWIDSALDYFAVDVVSGIATIENINVSDLPSGSSLEKIKFGFESNKSGSVICPVNGSLSVKIPSVEATPFAVPYSKPARIEVMVNGRGVGLEGFYVSLRIPGNDDEFNIVTDSLGKANFAFVPMVPGNIIVKIENRTSDTKILVTAWTLYIGAPDFVDEGQTFVIQIKNGSSSGPDVIDAYVIFAGETKTTDYTFTAPSISSAIPMTITANKEGFPEVTKQITILNVPKLIIISNSTNISLKNKPYNMELIIADDEGRAIVGAIVTFNGATYMSGANGIVTILTPYEPESYTVEVSKEGFSNSSMILDFYKKAKSTPGFEILIFVGALAVSLILLRKNRCKEQ